MASHLELNDIYYKWYEYERDYSEIAEGCKGWEYSNSYFLSDEPSICDHYYAIIYTDANGNLVIGKR